jgi:hypothetical protein
MQWLIQELGAIIERVASAPAPGEPIAELRSRIQRLVRTIASAEGVLAAFASYEGLVFAKGMHNLLHQAAGRVALGPATQMVAVGADRKLAILPAAPFVVGILCASTTVLSRSLARLEGEAPPSPV